MTDSWSAGGGTDEPSLCYQARKQKQTNKRKHEVMSKGIRDQTEKIATNKIGQFEH